MSYHIKKGFTLAEVLITLGIIGVVAAMTIPNMITKFTKNIVEVRLKEDYSIFQQVIQFAEYNDLSLEVDLPNDNLNAIKEFYQTYIAPNTKVPTVCFNEAGCWHAKNPTKNLAGATAYYNVTGVGVGADILAMRLNNGSNVIIDAYGSSSIYNYFGVKITEPSTVIVMIDANGDSAPNMIGKDIYPYVFTSRGILPAGYDMTKDEIDRNCSTTSSSQNAGYFCSAKVINDGWAIADAVWKRKS